MKRTWLALAVPLLLSLGASAAAQTSAPSPDDLARADAAFNAGRALLDAGQYTDACAKFAESKHFAPGLGVTLYLADCYERIGRTASAWTEFRSAEGLARARNDARAAVARARAQGLEPKLPRLTIAVAPTVTRAGLRVALDGKPVSEEEWGLGLPVDPGDHVVVASSPTAHRTWSARLDGEHPESVIRVDGLDEAPSPAPAPAPVLQTPPAAPAAATEAHAAPAPDPGATQRWIGVGLMGAGAVGLAVGGVFGLIAQSRLSASNTGSPPPCNAADQCDKNGLSLRQDAKSAATGSTIGFVAGAVFAAGGVAVYFTAPRRPSTAFTLAPLTVAGGGGLAVGGTF